MPLDLLVTLGCIVGTGVLGIREQVKCSPDKASIEARKAGDIMRKIQRLTFEEKYRLYVEAYNDDPPAMTYYPKYDPKVAICMERKLYDKIGLRWGPGNNFFAPNICKICFENDRNCSSLFNCLMAYNNCNCMSCYENRNKFAKIKDSWQTASSICHIKNWENLYGKNFIEQEKKAHRGRSW